jgi:uncharacterized membrane protein
MFIISSVWLALVVSAPLLVPSDTLTDLSGTVGTHDNDALFEDLDPIPKTIYRIGDAECHQLANRSYFINGNQMPFCSRDVGLFIGLALGSGIVTFIFFRINPLLALVGLAPIGIDGGVQMVTDYESNNPLRLVTGIIAGIALSMLLAHFFFALQREDEQPEDNSPSSNGQT